MSSADATMSKESSSLGLESPDGNILSVRDISVEFWRKSTGWTRVVDKVSFDVPAGARVGLVGESGSGKTMTGLSILGLIPRPNGRLASGSIVFGGVDLTKSSPGELSAIRGNEIAMVFQEPMRSLNPVMTVGDQIAESLRRHRGWSKKKSLERAVGLLDRVEIPAARQRSQEYPHHLSGGMRQRAMIALALACEPKLLIADEPTTALDVTVQAQIIELFHELSVEMGMAVVFITHDLGVVAELCDDLLVMYSGEIVETGSVRGVFENPSHPYTAGLMAALPDMKSEGRGLSFIPGRPPDPMALPPGCRFQPRCGFALDVCDTVPEFRHLHGNQGSRCHLTGEIVLKGVN